MIAVVEVAGYRIVGELGRSADLVVHRGRSDAGRDVLLRSALRPRGAELLGREHALRRDLAVSGLLPVVELIDGTCLVVEDRGGEPLAGGGRPGEPASFYPLALGLAAIVGELHRAGVIHRNLQPASILVHPVTREVWLEGLERATRGAADAQPFEAPAQLAYASPEQTGRMNRAIDHRSDLYSLGVIFYELLTGQRPFRAADPLELVHAHIAMTPPPPAGVPEALARVVMKLLEKTADARYQSAAGLAADLELCARGAAAPFPLGAGDVSERFLIPRQLYGRDAEVGELTRAFEQAARGPSSLMLVSGTAGVGKTTLIQELHGAVVRRRGSFAAGKFDQVARSVPYGALLQAFRGLAQQLLTESEEQLAARRADLARALGGNGAVLCEVLPEMALILGEQPPLPPLPPAEAQNRFRLVFQSFAGALAREAQPLVVFLDDLQWADAASLALLPALLELRFLFLVGSYRDNEVGDDHPLAQTVAALQAAGARVGRILLAPLGPAPLGRLVGDCLRRHDAEVTALAGLCADKTAGNPFFVIQFLQSLRHDGLLAFDAGGRRWTFRMEDIGRAPMTSNVIELLSRRIERLSPRARNALVLAACVGSPFDVATLALVIRATTDETAALLAEARAEGLVVADGPDRHAFIHDRVQQAAYARLPEESRPGAHLAVGRLLRERRGDEEARLFDIVGHLDMGRALIEDPAERLDLARANLAAGKRAKSMAAFQAALGYFSAGLELLPDERWEAEHALSFELEREAAEHEYLCGRFDDAERRFGALLARARTTLERAEVHHLRVLMHESLARYAHAARIGAEGLALFGVTFPDGDGAQRAALDDELAEIDRLLAGRAIPSLVELPPMEDAAMRMLLLLLTDVWAPFYITRGAPLASLVSARMVSLSIRHGNTAESAYGYVTHAIAVGPTRGDHEAAYAWGTLALAVNERLGDRRLRARVHQQFNAHVTFWRRPLESCLAHAREACRSGLENGDFAYAGYGAFTESWPAFLGGRDLARFVRDLTPNLAVLERIRARGLAAAQRLMLAWARALQAQPAGDFDEAAFEREHGDNPLNMTLLHVSRLHRALLLEDHAAALEAAFQARRRGWGHGTIWPVMIDVWGALAMAASPEPFTLELATTCAALGRLAESCPENFGCFHLLLEGELRRLEGRVVEAVDRYDAAIRQARRTRSLQHEALAQELCGRLWMRRGNETVAAAYLGAARRLYREWGALAKVRQLESRYPQLGWPDDEPAPPPHDVRSVTKAAHAIAVEIVLEELLRKLVRIAIENAGAERGVFLRVRDGELEIAAEGSVGGEKIHAPGAAPPDSETTLARGVVQYVRKTGASLVLGDAAADPRFAGDPYIAAARPRSILCLPVMQQGKLAGVLYLENNLTAEAFTAERIEVLEILSAQAAIALENARLYREVETLKDRLEAENVYLQEEIRNEHNFEEMVGTSPALLTVLRAVERIAPTDSTVLIGGETGSGKELIARAIHDRSRRRERPLVKVNCGAIAAGLVESELFGHVKGAFTGALERRVGRFELAQGGTIFLDEIGEVPLETQVKLLRVLQEQEFEPVGASRTMRVDVRVIAATNRDLEEAVQKGRFRSDLFYRLNVVPLRVPPLRERRGDIPQLVAFFMSRFSRRFQKEVTGVARETMERLVAYGWPGNIRELQNVVERAVVLARGPTLVLDQDLLPSAAAPPTARASTPVAPVSEPAGLAMEDVERRHIAEVLRRTQGVIEGPSGAARILKLHPNTLRSRMKKLGVERS